MRKFLCYDTNDAASGKINVDSLGMLKSNSTVPSTDGSAYQQLVTDGDGNPKWEDRTHFTYTEQTVLIEEQEIIPTDGAVELPVTIDLVEGNSYMVVFDGVPYECVSALAYGHPYIGNPAVFGMDATSEPFLYCPAEGNMFFVYNSDPNASYTVGIYSGKEFVRKIDDKYLPTSVPCITKATAGQTIKVSSVDENGTPIKWEPVNFVQDLPSERIMIVNCIGTKLDATFSEMLDAINSGKTVMVLAKRYDGDLSTQTFLCTYSDGQNTLRFIYLDASQRYIKNVDVTTLSEYFNFAEAKPVYLASSTYPPGTGKGVILSSTTPGSSKDFKITVDDTGTISATEVT